MWENFAANDIARGDAYGSLLLVDLTGCGPLRCPIDGERPSPRLDGINRKPLTCRGLAIEIAGEEFVP